MTSNNLFSKAQHGFIAGRSCVTQPLEFMEDITEAIDSGKEVDVIYLDFCKAFDKVPHKRLLMKLQKYGIKGNILNCMKAFLSEGQQKVIVNGPEPSWEDITSGIPQGVSKDLFSSSFTLMSYIDLPGAVAGLIKLFADDAKVYSTAESNQKELALQNQVTRSETWAALWQMFFNILKCHHLHIGNLEADFKYEMTTNECKIGIEQVKSERDLEVIVDSKLKFREHINNKVNLANRNLGIISRTFSYIDKDMFLNLFKSLVRPHLEYASPILLPLYKTDKITIENVQGR